MNSKRAGQPRVSRCRRLTIRSPLATLKPGLMSEIRMLHQSSCYTARQGQTARCQHDSFARWSFHCVRDFRVYRCGSAGFNSPPPPDTRERSSVCDWGCSSLRRNCCRLWMGFRRCNGAVALARSAWSICRSIGRWRVRWTAGRYCVRKAPASAAYAAGLWQPSQSVLRSR